MAHLQHRRPQNVSGAFYVDTSCIDCDTCRWMAPEVFHREAGQSAVYQQPTGQKAHEKALQALLSCPTASIGTQDRDPRIKAVQQQFPLPIAGSVYHCGYHSEQSYGAASYLIQRPEGNVLVDSPRFAPPLVRQLEQRGGVRYLYLTHRDDVADHQKFHDHFGCDRILHQADLTPSTQGIERPLQGDQPWLLSPDLLIIPVPGHTQGHTVLLYQDRYLFTGDHLAWSDSLNKIIAFKNHCWYSWEKLKSSTQKLLNYSFEWLLPGHGRRHYAPAETMHQDLQACIHWMYQP
ncbi:MBL fold metallo-hydrolase [Lyngbya confervoides]|uniref:MBL fold metallo-hydrolase n=1 Tax=Lyngbya confervoides BDU141951 TaxID=1574623 RepID=A0ABD4T6I5_9CYAN|nr:MBL fold metallo-hydrolase [Lyngbya confervoides]MCM1984172.1 MBL fold metallo-hydrolase [Lyngbya confervoides BDU141951]